MSLDDREQQLFLPYTGVWRAYAALPGRVWIYVCIHVHASTPAAGAAAAATESAAALALYAETDFFRLRLLFGGNGGL